MLKYYYKIVQIIETFINILIASFFCVRNIFRANRIKKCSGNIHILGNGPSLKNDIEKIKASIKETDSIMVVNAFAKSELYEILKPSYYIMVDPEYLKKRINDDIKNDFDSIVNKTIWPLELFVPYTSRKNQFISELNAKNNNVSVIYFKNTPIIGGLQFVNNFLFKHNLANPLYQNVLVAAIFLSIKMQFSNIFIWGADHSWHEEFILREDNKIFINDKHFYDAHESKGFIHCKDDGTPLKVHELFYTLARLLEIYHTLESYSKICHCNIFNLSSKTWIDAFTRK